MRRANLAIENDSSNGGLVKKAMSSYRDEQRQSQELVIRYLRKAPEAERAQLKRMCSDYRDFRATIRDFQRRHLHAICTLSCFQSNLSACCNKDGIITFFADLVVNALFSPPHALDDLMQSLHTARDDMKCIYLGADGCRWHVKPLGCEMFLCDRALEGMKTADPQAAMVWQRLETEAKGFRWPDRPVLFDLIETRFLAAGLCSSLMYLHNSPGLMRIKRKAGLA
jgi:hypothetical protein